MQVATLRDKKGEESGKKKVMGFENIRVFVLTDFKSCIHSDGTAGIQTDWRFVSGVVQPDW